MKMFEYTLKPEDVVSGTEWSGTYTVPVSNPMVNFMDLSLVESNKPMVMKIFKNPACNNPLPGYAKPGDAGIDLAVWAQTGSGEISIGGHQSTLIPTGIYLAIPEGYVGLIRDRSGTASKKNLKVNAGVIDSGYRGEIKILLHNLTDSTVSVLDGERVAQILILPCPQMNLHEVGSLDELGDSHRGDSGFGSTGA